MTELSALNVKITGDSGSLKAAINSAEAELTGLAATAARTQAQTGRLGGAMNQVAGAFSRSRGAIQQVSFQVQDMAVQLAAGTNASVVFAQQGSQIASIFGPVGAIIGALAAVALPALAFAMANSSKEGEILAARAERLKAALEALSEATANLALQRQMLNSGAILQDEQIALNEINRLTAERAALEEKLGQTINFVGTARGAAQKQQLEAQRQIIQTQLEEIDGKLKALQTERDLATAARRRANEVRNAYREEAAAEQARIAAVARLQAAFNGVTSAASNAARAAASIGTAAEGAIAGVQRLATAMWDVAQARMQATANLAAMQTEFSPGGQAMMQYGGRGTQSDRPIEMNGQPLGMGDDGAGEVGGGGGGLQSQLQAEIEAMQEALMTQEQLQAESFARQQEMLSQALAQRLITQEEYQSLMQQAQATHEFAMTKSVNQGVTDTLSALGSLFQGSKKIGAAIALANSWIAFTEVLKDPAYAGRPWARIAAAGKALAAGLNAVRNIKSATPGGSSGGGGSGAGLSGEASAPQQAVQTMNFTITGDRFGFGENVIRQIAQQLNQSTRNGTQIRATVS